MQKKLVLFIWMSLVMLALLWHPYSKNDQFYIYKLAHFKLDDTHHQYLLLKNNSETTIYNDMDIKGPFESIIDAHKKRLEINNNSLIGDLYYLPIVRKNYAN